MTARLPFLSLWAAALSFGGCLVGELQGVPCGRDDECATGHFCDLTVDTCRQETDAVSAPRLQVTGVVDKDGVVVRDPFIDKEGTYQMALVVENQGLLSAIDVDAEFSELRCLNLAFDPATFPAAMAPDAVAQLAFSAAPDGTCGTPMITDWFLFYSGRGSRGTFNINIERAPPGAN